jgi:hypothetical protein
VKAVKWPVPFINKDSGWPADDHDPNYRWEFMTEYLHSAALLYCAYVASWSMINANVHRVEAVEPQEHVAHWEDDVICTR